MKRGKGDIREQKRRARERKLQAERTMDTDEKIPNETTPDIKDNLKDTSFVEDYWLRIIELLDHGNHLIKEGEWYEEDVEAFYSVKDSIMELLYSRPPGVQVSLKRVPYWVRCEACKDKAGSMLRSSFQSGEFGYFLGQIPLCSQDNEIPERGTLEMEVIYQGKKFCFHIPNEKAETWGVNISSLKPKAWIPAKEFHRQQYEMMMNDIQNLLEKISQ